LDAHKNVALTAHNLRGCVIGIVGLGEIGYALATKLYRAWGVRIIYHNRFTTHKDEKDIEATRVSFEDLLTASDCIILAIPGGGGTLITKEILSKMKQGARLVNVARGDLVDEEALADCLESGHLSAAGLDVFANEPSANLRLAKMRNVTLTAHTGGSAIETYAKFEEMAMLNVEAVLTNKRALSPVNEHLMVAN
jgi:lactate dehydrogenase-like 2-hydroxyacid dehydrogenase